MSIWKTLSAIDCKDHIEKKGKFSYLAWTWAWAMVKEEYPLSHYRLLGDTTFPDGTMEVRVEVTVQEGSDFGLTHTMWLPVLDFKNNAIQNPNAFDINSARMRCLVKCLAMFGLGHYIYAGESTPQEPAISADEIDRLTGLLATGGDAEYAVAIKSLSEAAMTEFFNSAPSGEKTKMKQAARDKEGAAMAAMKATCLYVREGLSSEDASAVKEALGELNEFEKKLVWNAFTEIEKTQIQEILK